MVSACDRQTTERLLYSVTSASPSVRLSVCHNVMLVLTHIYICMTIEELTAKIRPCERKKMQFILIGKLDNISIKLIA